MKKGFTMIEMLVAMALVALLLGVAVPSVMNITKSRASAELGNFNILLKKMFLKSIREQKYIRIIVDIKNGEYYAESTETPFSLIPGDDIEKVLKRNEKLLEDIEDKSDTFEGDGSHLGANTFYDIMKTKASESDEMNDYYNWENFVPPQKSIKEVLLPEYNPESKKMTLPSGLVWDKFFTYSTPVPLIREELLESQEDVNEEELSEEELAKLKRKTLAQSVIYIFPTGRVTPFYLSIAEEDGDPLFYIESDFFADTKITRGDIPEDLGDFKKMFEYSEDVEGK